MNLLLFWHESDPSLAQSPDSDLLGFIPIDRDNQGVASSMPFHNNSGPSECSDHSLLCGGSSITNEHLDQLFRLVIQTLHRPHPARLIFLKGKDP
jgi:hypothetical protein